MKGWTAMTKFIGGDELVWHIEDGGLNIPDLYSTLKDVYKSIADDQITIMRQFINDERSWEDVDWNIQVYPVYLEVVDGVITIWVDDTKTAQIATMTIESWREGL
jgi:hypothetical protein